MLHGGIEEVSDNDLRIGGILKLVLHALHLLLCLDDVLLFWHLKRHIHRHINLVVRWELNNTVGITKYDEGLLELASVNRDFQLVIAILHRDLGGVVELNLDLDGVAILNGLDRVAEAEVVAIF